MSLFDELFGGILGESRPKSPEVAQTSPAENGSTARVIAQSPQSPALGDEKSAPTGEAPCPTCRSGSFWRGESGAWHCEGCDPPGNAHVATWRNIGGGRVPPMPPPALAWPAELSADLRRVSEHFEWTPGDRRDFVAWARRSIESVADARLFLETERDKMDLALSRLNEPRRPDAANTEGGQ